MRRINQMEPWIGEEEKRAVIEYLNSGGWLTEYKKTKEFEQMIANYVGSKNASVVSNGTISLVITLMALNIKEGDEVIVPDYTMIASANAVRMVGATPILVDIDRTNLCLDLNLVRNAITPKTKAIMLVTINGRYPDMDKFVKFSKDSDLYLIEDAAQSLGSRYKGKHLGTFGDAGSFSFSVPKVITTGQGGALVTDNEELFKKMSMIKDFGRTRGGIDYHEIFGFNAKFTDLQAVIGIEQMKKLDWRVERKKEIYRIYRDLLSSIEEIEFIETNLKDTSPWFIDILVNEKKKDELISFLKERGIWTRPFYPPIHTQPIYSHINGDFKNAEYISKKGLWLPSASFLSDEELEYICNNITEFFTHKVR